MTVAAENIAEKKAADSFEADTAAAVESNLYAQQYGQPPAAVAAAANAVAAAMQQQQQHLLNQQNLLNQQYYGNSQHLGLQLDPTTLSGANIALTSLQQNVLHNNQPQHIVSAAGDSSAGGMLLNLNGLYYPSAAVAAGALYTNSNPTTNFSLTNNNHLIQQHQQQQQQQQQFLLPANVSMQPTAAAGGGGAVPQQFGFSAPKLAIEQTAAGSAAASFEGVPIFIVPQSGALSLNALQRANEFKLAQLTGTLTPAMTSFTPKIDTSKHFHVFVGDLASDVDNKLLREAFEKCGTITDAKVIRDPQSLKSRGYGFVSFPDKKDAQKAIDEMNGVMVGSRAVRTNWASRRATTSSTTAGASEDEKASTNNKNCNEDNNNNGGGTRSESTVSETNNSSSAASDKATALERLMDATDAENTTVYLGNLVANGALLESSNDTGKQEELREAFKRFGDIKEIRLFLAQNYGFVIFEKKRSAAEAILEMNGSELRPGCGRRIRCSWGRAGLGAVNSHDHTNLSALATAQFIATQFAASQQNNQTIAAAAQNANAAIIAAQIAAVNQQQQQQQLQQQLQQQQQQQMAAAAAVAAASVSAYAGPQPQQLLPYYASTTGATTAFDAATLSATASMAANSLYSAQPQNAWHV